MSETAQVCFRLPQPNCTDAGSPADPLTPLDLPVSQAEAMTELLQVFACGEESAALAFTHLAGTQAEAVVRNSLVRIAAEEAAHEVLLRSLRLSLPEPAPEIGLRRAMVRFFGRLREDDAGRHLAGIAALDSGVCTVVSALLRDRMPLAREARAQQVFSRIHREEAGHVRLSRVLARELAGRNAAQEKAARTREGLVAILSLRGEAFDALGVDPDSLFARLRQPPRGLFA